MAKNIVTTNKNQRLEAVNKLISVIATHGRKFFWYRGALARMEIDERGRIWFIDEYEGSRIYTHYRGEWQKFTHGGTLKSLVIAFRDYIQFGHINLKYFGPWPDWVCNGDLWGYKDDMQIVREAAKALLSPEI